MLVGIPTPCGYKLSPSLKLVWRDNKKLSVVVREFIITQV